MKLDSTLPLTWIVGLVASMVGGVITVFVQFKQVQTRLEAVERTQHELDVELESIKPVVHEIRERLVRVETLLETMNKRS